MYCIFLAFSKILKREALPLRGEGGRLGGILSAPLLRRGGRGRVQSQNAVASTRRRGGSEIHRGGVPRCGDGRDLTAAADDDATNNESDPLRIRVCDRGVESKNWNVLNIEPKSRMIIGFSGVLKTTICRTF